jgi:hypothetical protein
MKRASGGRRGMSLSVELPTSAAELSVLREHRGGTANLPMGSSLNAATTQPERRSARKHA